MEEVVAVARRGRRDADLFEVSADRFGVPVTVRPDERERDRGMHARGRLVRPPTAEHLEMSGHAVAKRDLEALRARAPVGRIETIDRRALTHDRPRGRELAECQRQSSLEVRLSQHVWTDVEPTLQGELVPHPPTP